VSLDVSALSVLNHLNAGGMSQLTNLVTSNESLSLDYINISDSAIVNPDFTHLLIIRELDVSGMLSENIDFAKLGNINYLRMDRSNLTSFDTAWVPSVERLSLEHNKLTQIHLSNPEKLVRLELDHNELTQINTAGLVNLGTLWIPHNQISELDLSHLDRLWQLGLYITDIKEIDFNYNINLQYINAGYSGMTYINNLDSLRYGLRELWLPNTPLSIEMQTKLDELSQLEGYDNIYYTFAHSVVVKTNEFGSVDARRANTEDGDIRSIFFTPNEGYKLGSYSGCENMQYNEGNNWLNIGPITQDCELILEFVPIN
jgi:Leucine-rich repeat (LRR) protein